MGFKEVRARVIAGLESDQYAHEPRADIREKNLLHAKEVTPGFVVRLLLRCSGDDYESSRHHFDPDRICHVFTPQKWGERWYVKVYFLESVPVFVSVHPS